MHHDMLHQNLIVSLIPGRCITLIVKELQTLGAYNADTSKVPTGTLVPEICSTLFNAVPHSKLELQHCHAAYQS